MLGPKLDKESRHKFIEVSTQPGGHKWAHYLVNWWIIGCLLQVPHYGRFGSDQWHTYVKCTEATPSWSVCALRGLLKHSASMPQKRRRNTMGYTTFFQPVWPTLPRKTLNTNIHWVAQSDHDKWSCISLMCSIWTTLLACDNGVLGAHMLYSEDISYVTEICRKTTVWFFSWSESGWHLWMKCN